MTEAPRPVLPAHDRETLMRERENLQSKTSRTFGELRRLLRNYQDEATEGRQHAIQNRLRDLGTMVKKLIEVDQQVSMHAGRLGHIAEWKKLYELAWQLGIPDLPERAF